MSLHHLGRIAIISTALTALCGAGCMNTESVQLDYPDEIEFSRQMAEVIETDRCYIDQDQSQHCKELLEKAGPERLKEIDKRIQEGRKITEEAKQKQELAH